MNSPQGKLFVVGTPIGNLGDMTFRAVEVLKSADFIASEDTRVSSKLLNYFEIKKPLVSYLFANPDTTKGDQVRGIIKTGNLNLGTSIETQMTRMRKGMSLFPDLS